MGLKRKPPTSLLDLLEGQLGKGAQGTSQSSVPSPPPQPQTIQTRSSSTKSQPQSPRPKLPTLPQTALPPQPEPTDSKRKRSPKDGTQKQAEEQTKRLLEAEDQLQIVKEQISDLKKRLISAENAKGVAEYARDEAVRAKQEAEFARNEAEAARDKAEDEGYNMGVVETQASLKAQIPGVCRLYCSQSIFYPPAIREAASASSEAMSDQHEAGVTQSEAAQISVPPRESLKGGKLHDVIEALESMDPEVPKEDAEPMVSAQIPDADEPAILA
ncbi:uncharacterized protein LOC115973614 [Quercus lobata]|uniref:uncharacterized protein LOC115951753 n=1 Tax=Quercus lobata TaxID=97700 RepID=UPI0012470061|nr:uncharacterized protein LOC115951753 [Quercus lobata]XP_030949730.1 uncharacterized protein LOC115973614 [Quercus lobata]